MAAKSPGSAPNRLFIDECARTLESFWAGVRERAEADGNVDYLDDPHLIVAIQRSLAAATDKTYHYVLITQLLAKVTRPKLNARSLQKGSLIEGAFDPRTLYKKVIVPFERRQLDGALGDSPDPYVNNPVRVPLLTRTGRSSKKYAEMWDRLCDVVDAVEDGGEEFARAAFRQVLLEIYRNLGSTKIKYDIPLRASLAAVIATIESFTGEQSGGDRPLALAAALFEVVGNYFRLFQDVRREKINTSDMASGQVADIECLRADGTVVIAVEVKDRTLNVWIWMRSYVPLASVESESWRIWPNGLPGSSRPVRISTSSDCWSSLEPFSPLPAKNRGGIF